MAKTKVTESLCKNCRYWQSKPDTRFDNWGTCEMAGVYNDELANRDTKMIAVSGELWSRIETSPEFSCMMFEVK
jgi:hypothetical protein